MTGERDVGAEHSGLHGGNVPDESTLKVAPSDARAPALNTATLHVVHSPDSTAAGRSFGLIPSDIPLLIGRSMDDSNIRVRDPRIVWDDNQKAFRFGDAGSANGCQLNGRRSAGAALGQGDVLRMGDSLFVFVHASPSAKLQEVVAQVAASHLPVLIVGETGTGKELTARRIHELSGRRGYFVAVNCAAFPRDLLASELFGHARGAFSSATHARPGLFMQAQDGTMLLDEIGDLPLEQQPALLRVLQERTMRPVGSDREVPITARVLAATHIDIVARIETGQFRADLYARLAQVIVRVAPLRERREEILQLARLFAAQAGRDLSISADAAERMLVWHWPFNTRELQALVAAFCATTPADQPLELEYLRDRDQAMTVRDRDPSWVVQQSSEKEPSEDVDFGAIFGTKPCKCDQLPERDHRAFSSKELRLREELLGHLRRHKGNVTKVSLEMGKARMQVQRWLKRYRIDPEQFRA